MKLLRYLLNTILFVVIWCIMFLPLMKFSIDTGVTSIAAIGGIIAIIISYSLVKKINASNLWSRIFDVTKSDNDLVKEKKVEALQEKTKKKFEEKDSNIFSPKNISIVALVIVLIFVFNNQKTESTSKKDTKTELIEFEEDINKIHIITSDKLYSAGAYAARAEILFHDIWRKKDVKKRNLYIDAAIKEIDNAIFLEPSNWSLYFRRAEFLETKAQKSRGTVNQSPGDNYNHVLLQKTLVDLEIAMTLLPQKGYAYAEHHQPFNLDYESAEAAIYLYKSIAKRGLGLPHCNDLRKACKLDFHISSNCRGEGVRHRECF